MRVFGSVLQLVGLAAVAAGAWSVASWLGLVVGGVVLVGVGALVERGDA